MPRRDNAVRIGRQAAAGLTASSKQFSQLFVLIDIQLVIFVGIDLVKQPFENLRVVFESRDSADSAPRFFSA